MLAWNGRPSSIQWQRKYYRCVKKFGRGYMQGEARPEERDECLDRFDDFQKCVLVSTRLPLALPQKTETDGRRWPAVIERGGFYVIWVLSWYC